MTASDRLDHRVCPDAEQLAAYADGTLGVEDRAAVEAHLVECADCRNVLAETMAFSLADAPPKPVPAPVIAFRSRRWLAGAGVGLAAAATLVLVINTVSKGGVPPFSSLNAAYAQDRPVELRFPGVGYGPLRVTRGRPLAEQSTRVLEALALIRRHLERPEPEAQWLHASARADLFLWQYDHAIQTLQQAADLGRTDPILWIDFGIAYFERAEANNTPNDYAKAIEMFSKSASDGLLTTEALFNRGIVYSKLKQFDAALTDLNRALETERDPGWIAELRTRIAEIRAARARLLGAVPGVPPAFLAEAQFEDVLRGDLLDRSHKPALQSLAGQLAADHGDSWLRDALSAGGSGDLARSAQTLEAMARIRKRVQIADYEPLAPAIDALVPAELPEPFAVWRAFELLYRASHTQALSNCPNVTGVLARANALGYRWFEIQISLEQSTCEVGAARLASAEQFTRRAVAVATTNRFPVALLRARGFLSSHLVEEGRYRESFRMDVAALQDIVDAGYPVFRAHQFFDDIMRAAEGLRWWHVARASAEMASEVARVAGYDLQRALATYKAASFSEAAGGADAPTLYSAAIEQFSAVTPTADTRAYRAFIEVGALAARNDYEALMRRRAAISERGNVFFELPLLTALAAGAFKQHDLASAEKYAREAAQYGATQATPMLIRREFTQVLDRADQLLVLIAIERQEPDRGLAAWRQHLLRLAVARGAKGQVRSAADPGGSSARMTLANIQGRVGIWLEADEDVRFRWASKSFDETAAELRRLRALCEHRYSSTESILRVAGGLIDSGVGDVLRRRPHATSVTLEATDDLASFELALSLAMPDVKVIVSPYGLGGEPALGPLTPATFMAVSAAARRNDVDLPALPGADAEVRQLTDVIEGSHVETGSTVTSRALERALQEDRVVHFAGHAIRSDEGVALVLAPDPADTRTDARMGLWRLSSTTHIRAGLVVLSACSTGAIETLDTTAGNGMAESAILAGAQRVIAASWDVDSSAAERFNRLFYRNLVRLGSAVEAFHQAKDELRGERDSHPFFWAAFVLYARASQD